MKKKKKKKYIITLFVIIIIFFSLFYFINDKSRDNILTDFLKDLSASITKVTIHKSNDTSILINEINKDYEKEIKNLKDTLNLNTLNSNKKLINATVIKRSSNYWYDIISIDKGKKDGIRKGLAVINNQGLIGKIVNVNNYTSDVKLLISANNDNYISASFIYNDNNYYGLINQYDIKTNELKLTDVIGDFDINKLKGINVVTSGLTDSFTSGLIIGKIKTIKKDTFGISNTIIIEPFVNFNSLNIVTIVVGDK